VGVPIGRASVIHTLKDPLRYLDVIDNSVITVFIACIYRHAYSTPRLYCIMGTSIDKAAHMTYSG